MRLLGHVVARNALALYGVQFARYLLPLVTIPYLARVLHPEGLGLVLLAQSFATLLALLLEYGFNLSATREIARNWADKDHVAQVVAGVTGAKGLLLLVAALGAIIAAWSVPAFRGHPAYPWLACLIAAGQGLIPLWYFQGLERMQLPALLDLGTRILSTVGILIWVRAPDDGWKALILYGAAGVLASGASTLWMYRNLPILRPRLTQVWSALRIGWTMFIFRCVTSLYVVANTFILGLFVPPALVSYYGGAEKISKVFVGLVYPFAQALYPRMNSLVAHDYKRAASLARLTFLLMGGIGLTLGGLIAILAPELVDLVLGPGYSPAVPVLRVLAMLIPLVALSNVLGMQWMLILGMDRTFTAITAGAGMLNVGLAFLLAPRFGPLGMAWTVVCAEAFVTLAMWYVVQRSGHDFLKGVQKEP